MSSTYRVQNELTALTDTALL